MPIQLINHKNEDAKQEPVEFVGIAMKQVPYLTGSLGLRVYLQEATPEKLNETTVVAKDQDSVIQTLLDKCIDNLEDDREIHIFECDKPINELLGVTNDKERTPKAMHDFISKAVLNYKHFDGGYVDAEPVIPEIFEALSKMGFFNTPSDLAAKDDNLKLEDTQAPSLNKKN